MQTPKMQRRHFELIASVIRYAAIDRNARDVLIEEFVSALRGTNGNFDVEKFRAAAGWFRT